MSEATRGEKVHHEPRLRKTMASSKDNWRISFEYYAVVEQTHVKDDWMVNCAELFHLTYRPLGYGPANTVLSKWCLKGKNLRMNSLPSQEFGVFEPANQVDWQLRKWTRVELTMQWDKNDYYFSFIVDGEVISREPYQYLYYGEGPIRAPIIRDVELYSGCINYNIGPVWEFPGWENYEPSIEYYRKWGKCEAVDVYIDNVQMDTWRTDPYMSSLTPNTIGTGGCREEYFPLFEKCVKIFPDMVTWDEANGLCEADNAELLSKGSKVLQLFGQVQYY